MGWGARDTATRVISECVTERDEEEDVAGVFRTDWHADEKVNIGCLRLTV